MRKLMDLVELDDRGVFVYFRTPALCRDFMCNAEAEGITFGDGVRPSQRDDTDIFALHAEKTIAYVGAVGHMAFSAGARVCVDYEKYRNGEEDFIIK
jgi:hypothetical protein